MRELWIGAGSANSEKGGALSCEYSVLVEELDSVVFLESYGVKVACKETGEVASAAHLTVSAERILAFVECLCRNVVTPGGLDDVIADWL